VIAQIDVRRRVGGRFEHHLQLIGFAEAVIGDRLESARKALHAVGADEAKTDARDTVFGIGQSLPKQVIEPHRPAVQMMLAEVSGHLVGPAVDRELPLADPIAEPTDRRTEVRVLAEIGLQVAERKIDVLDPALGVRQVDIHQDGTIVGQPN